MTAAEDEGRQTSETPLAAPGPQPVAGISDDAVREFSALLQDGNVDDAARAAKSLHASDLADLFEKLEHDNRINLIHLLEGSIDADVFAYMDHRLSTELLEHMDIYHIARIVGEMESDDAIYLIEALNTETQKEILSAVSRKVRAAVEEGLTFPEDSAGRIMTRELVAIPQSWTVGKTIDYMRAAAHTLPENFYDVFVVDLAHRVVGSVALSHILRSARPTRIEALIDATPYAIPASMDQEEAAFIFRRDGLVTAPVIDESGRLIGVITVDDIVDVIDEEAEEDILKLGGVAGGDIYQAAVRTAQARFSWLAINLLTAVLASYVIGLFEEALEKAVALAILMPIVASMGGNAGTQTLTVAVRALATRELSSANAWRVISKELVVGVINGFLFALLTGGVAWLWFGMPEIGLVIAAAMLINLVAAALAGVTIPLILNKTGFDPAISSGVFLTTVTDVVGFLAFLGLAALLII